MCGKICALSRELGFKGCLLVRQAANSEYELLERMNLSEHENQADFTEGLRVLVERLKQQNDRVRDFVFTLSLSELFVLLVWSFCALLYRFCRVCCRVLDGVLGDRLERYAESDADEISWLYFASPELANKVIQALHTHH